LCGLQARQALPTVNLAADGYDVLGGGYGIAFNGGKEGATGLSKASAAADIIRDVNRHAEVVLNGIDAAPSSDTGAVASALAKAEQSKVRQEDADWDKSNHEKWAEAARQEGRGLSDLRAKEELQAEALSIQDPRRYFDAAGGEGVVSDGQPSTSSTGGGSMAEMLAGVSAAVLPCPALKPALASRVLTEISLRVQAAVAESEDGFMMGDPKEVLLPALQAELRKQAQMVNELLRHFWALFPISTPARAAKLERLKTSLSKQYDHLQAMQEAAHGSDRIYISQVLRPCMQALDAAFTKYDTEQSLRAAKRQKLSPSHTAVTAAG
jgi:transcription initiation factor TFIIH subunit 1